MIVGLCGKIGCGKSTAAEYLKTKGFIEYSFATPLKEIGLTLGFTRDELYVDKNKINEIWGISGRKFLQTFGTEVCRDFLPKVLPSMEKVWIQLFHQFVKMNKDKNIVVSDVRFKDEFDAVKSYGGKIIRIIKVKYIPVAICEYYDDLYDVYFLNDEIYKIQTKFLHSINDVICKSEDESEHLSEKLDVKADCIIINSGTLEEFYLILDFAI